MLVFCMELYLKDNVMKNCKHWKEILIKRYNIDRKLKRKVNGKKLIDMKSTRLMELQFSNKILKKSSKENRSRDWVTEGIIELFLRISPH